jgi:P2 family phage major capsid protein
MKKNTRLLYGKLLTGMAKTYGIDVADVSKEFAIEIPQETALNDKIQESSDFLTRITMAVVEDTKGQALEMGVEGLLAKRTEITGSVVRQPNMAGAPTGSTWEVAFTEFDVAIKYNTLDQWARYKDFFQRYMNAVRRQIALDKITIGFHGESRATTTDPVANPLGQDVNVGWLKLIETQAPERYLKEGAVTDVISLGAAGDYKNLDALAYDLFASIPVEHRTGNEVVVVGAALVADDVSKGLSKNAGTPTEKAVGITELSNQYGGLPAIQVPKFPDMGVLVTDLANLHLYNQEGRMRRNSVEESNANRVVDYISSNDAYAVGNLKAVAAVHAPNMAFKEA